MTDDEKRTAEQIKSNLLSEIEYLKKLNEQICGRVDAYENIIRMMLKILMER